MTANGPVNRRCIQLQMQLIDQYGQAIPCWFLDSAVITPDTGGNRFSGTNMPDLLCFGTALGNTVLYVAATIILRFNECSLEQRNQKPPSPSCNENPIIH